MQGKPEHDIKNNINFQGDLMVQVRDILRRNSYHFVNFRPASKLEDTKQATDMVMRVDGKVTIAIRVRRPRPNRKEYRDLTLRSLARGGGRTELDKIKEGWADWYFYGWANTAGKVNEWILVDLHALRLSGVLNKQRRTIPNGDGTGFVTIAVPEIRKAKALQCGVLSSNGYVFDVQRVVELPPLQLPKHLEQAS